LTALDRRLHAFRDDLADVRLAGRIAAPRFAEGRSARVTAAFADMRRAPRSDAGLDTQLLHGDDVTVFEQVGKWAWVQAANDGYVGYVPASALGAAEGEPTHMVSAPRSFVYAQADMKLPTTGVLSIGSRVAVAGFEERRGTRYALLGSGGAVIAAHLRDTADRAPDYVDVAEMLVNTPYLWGGATAFGIDCSGLVQLSMRMAGRNVLRDSDMQAANLGDAFDPASVAPKRGDLVFWKGHAAIMTDPRTIIHANGHTMLVSREPLAGAIERIGYLYGQPTGFRRP